MMDLMRLPESVLAQWQRLVDVVARTMGVPTAVITRVEPPSIEVIKTSSNADNPYYEGARAELATRYCREVVSRRKQFLIEDARQSDRWRNAPEVEVGLVSYLGLPLLWPDGEIFGTICVLDTKANRYSEDYIELMEQFRALVESHLQILRQRNELREQLEEIRELRTILPICCRCNRVRDDRHGWQEIEEYVQMHPTARLSLCTCPDCAGKLYPGIWGRSPEQGESRR